jgi:hypothetical protein
MQDKLGMFGFEALICGFSDVNSGNKDYGQGILRVDSRLITEIASKGHQLVRNDLIRLENSSHDKIFATLRVAELDHPRKIALELDDRLKLGLEKQQSQHLFLRRAYKIEAISYFWNHSNPTVRIEFKLAVILSAMSFLLGAIVSLMLTLA